MLAAYGMLDGETATTHHLYQRGIQQRYPAVHFVEGMRFVENDKVSTAAGLTSGIDLALHVVERYYGRPVAQATADYMEYRGDLWKNPEVASVATEAPENRTAGPAPCLARSRFTACTKVVGNPSFASVFVKFSTGTDYGEGKSFVSNECASYREFSAEIDRLQGELEKLRVSARFQFEKEGQRFKG